MPSYSEIANWPTRSTTHNSISECSKLWVFDVNTQLDHHNGHVKHPELTVAFCKQHSNTVAYIRLLIMLQQVEASY